MISHFTETCNILPDFPDALELYQDSNEQPQYPTVEDADVKSYPVGNRPVSIAWECYIEFSPPQSPSTQTKKRKVVPVGRRPFSERSDRGQPRRQLHYLRHGKYQEVILIEEIQMTQKCSHLIPFQV